VSEVNQALRKFYERRSIEKGVTGDSPEMVWLVENITRELNISENDEVLDVGCGDAYVLQRVRDKVDVKGYGVDVSAKTVEVAKILTGHFRVDLQLCLGEVTHLPFSDNFFDKIICSEIIEHVHNNTKFLKEMRRVLRPAGLAYVTFPNKKVSFLFRWYCDTVDKIEGHLRRYELARFEYLVKKSGFKVVNVRYAGHFLIWLVHQFITYNIPVKSFLKKRYEERNRDDRKLDSVRRPNYSRGLLSRLYYCIFMLDLKFNQENCLKCHVIIQKSDVADRKMK